MERENFPFVTFILATAYLVVFLFTYNNLEIFEQEFGFTPKTPKIHSLITYSFIHVDYIHLITNLLFLFIAGLAIEKILGKFYFFAIYLTSSNVAVIFDILGRFLSGVSFEIPFVGGSGAIFGLLTVASLVRPTEKIPSLLILVMFLPFFNLDLLSNVFSNFTFLVIFFALFATFLVFLIFSYFYLPLSVAVLFFLLNWLVSFTVKYPLSISYLGHLGGVVGGILSFFLFAQEGI